jgi:2-keto-4-pentenoate hydratase/2-oxohepta-3-ene-1,7-dioic acid hydratase in catechol pathway
MKILFFDDFKLGVLEAGAVVDVSGVVRDIPHTGPHDLISGLIERFADYRPRLAEAARQGRGAPIDRVRIRPPVPRPVNIVAMAVNYMEDGTRAEPAPINAFHKSPTAVIGQGDTMVLPDVPATIFEGEAEMALVIGKRASHVSQARAMDHVFGYVNFIDGSARGLPPSGNTFYQMKSRDTFAPIGPYIVTADEVRDPHALQIRLWVNGILKQNFNTSDMAHKIPGTSSPPAPTIAGSAPSRRAMSSSWRPRASVACASTSGTTSSAPGRARRASIGRRRGWKARRRSSPASTRRRLRRRARPRATVAA